MTERERIHEGAEEVRMYKTTEPTYDRTTNVVATQPTDLVRWGPIFAGIFTTLATLIGLTVLGLAIGLETVDAGDQISDFGLGAGIWSSISALVAFFLGGFMAARSAAFGGRTSGILNGAMVWIVAIPLMVSLLGSGLNTLLGTVGNVAGSATNIAAPLVDNTAVQATVEAGATNLQDTAQNLQANVSAEDAAQVANNAADAAWGILLSLGLGALAAILGGYLGGKTQAHDTPDNNRAYTS